VTSHTTTRFRELFRDLPADVKRAGRAAYRRFRDDPSYPGLRFHRVHQTRPVYSASIGIHYRVVGIKDGNEIVWFWVGSHADYDALLAKL